MSRRKKFPKVPKKVWVGLAIVAAVVVGAWGAQKMGWVGGRVIGSLEMRPWRRASAKPVGVRIEPVETRAPRTPAPSEKPRVAPGSGGKLAIILDDWGVSEALVDDVIALKRPITFAILPHLEHSGDIARAASRHGLGVMLHMPMQAKSKNVAKEEEIITVGASEVRIRRYLDEALASIPGVRGVNNHQGSAATSDLRVMRTVLTHLKQKDLFFIDSFVIATTAGPEAAKETGIRFSKRDVFIDNEVDVESIKAQLRKAIKKAQANKTAIAIGHDKGPTVKAIAQMIPEIEKAGVQLVLAEDLVR